MLSGIKAENTGTKVKIIAELAESVNGIETFSIEICNGLVNNWGEDKIKTHMKNQTKCFVEDLFKSEDFSEVTKFIQGFMDMTNFKNLKTTTI
jgi:hypothetical protein